MANQPHQAAQCDESEEQLKNPEAEKKIREGVADALRLTQEQVDEVYAAIPEPEADNKKRKANNHWQKIRRRAWRLTWPPRIPETLTTIAYIALTVIAIAQLFDLRKANESASAATKAATAATLAQQQTAAAGERIAKATNDVAVANKDTAQANQRAAEASDRIAGATAEIASANKDTASANRQTAQAAKDTAERLSSVADSLKRANETAAGLSLLAAQLATTQEEYRKQSQQMSEIERRPYLGIAATLEPSRITNQLVIKVQVHNHGLTPAYDLSCVEYADCLPLFDDGSNLTVPTPIVVAKPIFVPAAAPALGPTIQPGGSLLEISYANMTNWAAWDAGTVKGWIYGRATYTDIFGKRRTTNFRLYRGPDLQTGQQTFFQASGGNDSD